MRCYHRTAVGIALATGMRGATPASIGCWLEIVMARHSQNLLAAIAARRVGLSGYAVAWWMRRTITVRSDRRLARDHRGGAA